MVATQQLEPKEKQEVSAAEGTRTSRMYIPAVDIFETPDGITLLADMPGVKAEDLKIDLKDHVLTLRGDVAPPEAENEEAILREYEWGSYFREFSLAETIDQNKIEAHLTDGVLRLTLPKLEAAKPRRIAVKAV